MSKYPTESQYRNKSCRACRSALDACAIFAATKPDSHLQGVPICGFSGGNQGQWLVVRDKMILGRVSKNHFNRVDVTFSRRVCSGTVGRTARCLTTCPATSTAGSRWNILQRKYLNKQSPSPRPSPARCWRRTWPRLAASWRSTPRPCPRLPATWRPTPTSSAAPSPSRTTSWVAWVWVPPTLAVICSLDWNLELFTIWWVHTRLSQYNICSVQTLSIFSCVRWRAPSSRRTRWWGSSCPARQSEGEWTHFILIYSEKTVYKSVIEINLININPFYFIDWLWTIHALYYFCVLQINIICTNHSISLSL